MTPEPAAPEFIELARQALADAEALAGQGLSRRALIRAYHAAYNAVCALLDTKGIRAPSHQNAVALLRREFVGSGQIADEEAQRLGLLAQRRAQAERDQYSRIPNEIVEEALSTARGFVQRAEQAVRGA